MRTCLTNGTYRVVLCLYSGRAKPFSSFSWGGLILSAGCANLQGNPGPFFLGKFSNLGALHEIFSVESKSFQQVLSKVATFQNFIIFFFFSLLFFQHTSSSQKVNGGGGAETPSSAVPVTSSQHNLRSSAKTLCLHMTLN